MLSETEKVEHAEQMAVDGDTALKAAARDGDEAAAAQQLRLLDAQDEAAFAAGGAVEAFDPGRGLWPPATVLLAHDDGTFDIEFAPPPRGPGTTHERVVRWSLRSAQDLERDAAFVVACAHARDALLTAVPALGQGSATRAWDEAWRRAADRRRQEMGVAVVDVLMAGAGALPGGVDEREEGGVTTLMLAALGGHDLAVRRLLEAGADARLVHRSGRTPLYMAAENGHETVANRLLQAGALADAAEENGQTPLYIAASNGHDGVVTALLQAGATVNQWRRDREVPLFVAAQNGHEAVVHALVGGGAAVDQATSDGRTPLFMAAKNGFHDIVQVLLDQGAGVNPTITADGVTALMAAVHFGHARCVRLLLAAGTDAGAAMTAANDVPGSQVGDRALDIARRAGHGTIEAMLRAAAEE
jgi:ankyrin repeat protein